MIAVSGRQPAGSAAVEINRSDQDGSTSHRKDIHVLIWKAANRRWRCWPAWRLLVSGCGATGVSPQAPEGVPQAPSGTEPRVTVAMVTHAQPGDTFWDIIRLGAIDAATQSNVNLVYTSDGDAARQAVLVDEAVQGKVDALVVSVPERGGADPGDQEGDRRAHPGRRASTPAWSPTVTGAR